MNEIVIVNQFNPLGNRVGGVGKYLLSLIHHFPSNYKITFVCVTDNRSAVDKISTTLIGNREVKLLPILYVSEENLRSRIPLSLRFVIALNRTNLPAEACYLVQRFEYMIGLSKKQLPLSKFIGFVHTDLAKASNKNISESMWTKFPSIYKLLLKCTLNRCDKIISVSSKSIEFLNLEKVSCPSNIDYAPTWPDKDLFNLKTNDHSEKFADIFLWKKKLSKVLIFVGRFQKVKNVDLVIDVIERLPNDFGLLMVGGGDLFQDCKQRVDRNLNLSERIKFTGILNQEEVALLLGNSDFYISLSSYEGMSVALLEALSCGTPVVTTSTGEAENIIVNNVNGLLLDSWDPVYIATKIKNVASIEFSKEICSRSVDCYSPKMTIDLIQGYMNG